MKIKLNAQTKLTHNCNGCHKQNSQSDDRALHFSESQTKTFKKGRRSEQDDCENENERSVDWYVVLC